MSESENIENEKDSKWVRVSIAARVIDTSDSHGLCYLVELPQLDFNAPRQIWITADEID